MTQITFPADIINGHLRHERSLPELEGKRVIATLTVAAENAENVHNGKTPQNDPIAKFDSDLPPWSEVRHDLYFPMTAHSISLGQVNLKIEEGRPRIILPEELPDE